MLYRLNGKYSLSLRPVKKKNDEKLGVEMKTKTKFIEHVHKMVKTLAVLNNLSFKTPQGHEYLTCITKNIRQNER